MTSFVVPTLARWEPTAPRLTWYGDPGDRVELSGRVLLNWVTKSANLLTTECAVATGSTVQLDLPAHWRLLVWALGAWATGAEVTIGEHGEDPDVAVSDRPDRWLDGGAGDVIAVALPSLARAWPGELPAGAIDGAAELMGQPDDPMFPVPPLRGQVPDGGERVLLLADDPATLVEQAWACWREGGTAVVVTPRSDADLASIRDQEGITAR